jgi:hypothetical protein
MKSQLAKCFSYETLTGMTSSTMRKRANGFSSLRVSKGDFVTQNLYSREESKPARFAKTAKHAAPALVVLASTYGPPAFLLKK